MCYSCILRVEKKKGIDRFFFNGWLVFLYSKREVQEIFVLELFKQYILKGSFI